METSVEIPKMNKKDEDDLISQLPDGVLASILCFLDVEEAARTTTLSRRWKTLWKEAIAGTPRLAFYAKDGSDPETRWFQFVKLVNEIMRLHEAPTLQKLSIRFPVNSSCSRDINKWLEFAAKKGVETLELYFSSLFYPAYDGGGFFGNSPEASRFQCLRDLFLVGVDVGDHVMEHLFSSSPSIERLRVYYSKNLRNLNIVAPNLRYLVIISCENLQHLNISAPNLKRTKLCKGGPRGLRVSFSAPLLSHVTFGLDIFHLVMDQFDCFKHLLGQVCHVKKKLTLEVFDCIVESIDVSCPIPFPTLSNVEHLKLTIEIPRQLWRDTEKLWSTLHGHLWALALVKAAPVLQKLSFELGKTTNEDVCFKWMDEDIPKKAKENVSNYPPSKYLKVLEMIGFTGCRQEIELVLHLLEIAPSLQKLIIRLRRPTPLWFKVDTVRYERYQLAKIYQECAELLKTQMRPEVDVIII